MKLFLIVEWIDDSPTINGAKYYESKEEAVEAALHLEKLNRILSEGFAINVKHTICEIEKGDTISS
jgi:hypothetical protein